MCTSHLLYKCGKCPECLSERRNTWAARLMDEYNTMPQNGHALFGMMTYNDDALNSITLDYVDETTGETFKVYDFVPQIQKFAKRFRKLYPFVNFKYFVAAELGSRTKRLHHHPIFFLSLNMDWLTNGKKKRPSDIERYEEYSRALRSTASHIIMYQSHGKTISKRVPHFCYWIQKVLESIWQNGFLNLSPLDSVKGALYATKYIMKQSNELLHPVTRTIETMDTKIRGKVNKQVITTLSTSCTVVSNGLGINIVPRLLKQHQDVTVKETKVTFNPNSYDKFTIATDWMRSYLNDNFTCDYVYYDYSRPLRWTSPLGGDFPMPRYYVQKIKTALCERLNFPIEWLNQSQNLKFHLNYILRMIEYCNSHNIGYSVCINEDTLVPTITPLDDISPLAFSEYARMAKRSKQNIVRYQLNS